MSNLRHISKPYEPIVDECSKVLILGTAASVKSSELGFYYMHPQNRFWKVLGILLDYDLYNSDKNTKRKVLISKNVGLSDVIYSCDIVASDDSKITNIIINDIDKLIKNSQISHVFLNGGRAFQEFNKYFPHRKHMCTLLPSTSPRNARFSLGDLVESWKVILEYL